MTDTTTTLHALLDRGLALHPEYGAGLANHLPMALQALQALGADDARLRAFDARQRPRLRPRDHHGADGFEAQHARLTAALQRDGRDTLLRQALPGLMPGVAAAAFHGLIRTAHAVAAGHDGELVMGLAYWAHRHTPLLQPDADTPRLPPGAGPGDLPAAHWLTALQSLCEGRAVAGRLIVERMRAWAAQPDFAALAPRLRIDPDTLRALARAAAELYAASGNFTVLHMVTACHAMVTLQPWLDAPQAAWRPFSIAAAAALCAAAARPGEATPPKPWPTIVPRALASDDEHVVKLVHAARELETAWGGDRFRAAATRAVATMEVTA